MTADGPADVDGVPPHPVVGSRAEYRAGELPDPDPSQGLDPLGLARRWLDEAIAAGLPEPTAVSLATVDEDGTPDARMVLLRDLGPDGAVWYTNHDSVKGRQLAVTPAAALVAWWPAFERQIRLRGPVMRLADDESDAYFASRPRGSQLGAWASAQSTPVTDREVLEAQVARVTARFRDQPVPRPPFWGGYRLVPEVVECWQGRPSRLHDRLRFTRDGTGWRVQRLQP